MSINLCCEFIMLTAMHRASWLQIRVAAHCVLDKAAVLAILILWLFESQESDKALFCVKTVIARSRNNWDGSIEVSVAVENTQIVSMLQKKLRAYPLSFFCSNYSQQFCNTIHVNIYLFIMKSYT